VAPMVGAGRCVPRRVRRGTLAAVTTDPPVAALAARPRRGRISWGLGDFFLAYLASFVLATVASLALLGTGIELHLDCRPGTAASSGGATGSDAQERVS
jgi:hypothetical protein